MPNPRRFVEQPTLRIQLLGTFCVILNGHEIDPAQWRRRKASALIKLLALEPAHRLHRERIGDLLWGEHSPEQVTNSFHQTLYLARQILDPLGKEKTRWLRLEADFLLLAPDESVWTDVEEFEQAAAAAQHGQDTAAYWRALDLYAGELLPDDRFEEWASPRREALQQDYLNLLTALGELYRTRGDANQAIEIFKRVLEFDSTYERAHEELMRLYALMDRREQALKQFQQLRQALRAELDAEPSLESKQLYAQILAGTIAAKLPSRPNFASHSAQGKPVVALPNNLPLQLTSFIGREREIANVKRSLQTSRLVTLTGPGGCGKTRLALQVAREIMNDSADGVWLIELASLSDSTFVPRAVATALGIPEQPGRALSDTLKHTLANKELLLILDNCEHLVQACAQLANELLTYCHNVKILATSREALHVAGEVVWLVPSLALPDLQRPPTFEQLVAYESLRLFGERAAGVQPGFILTPENSMTVAQVCFRLDGIPLAIELAAARVKLLSVEQILTRLDDRFHLLTSGNRTAVNRQQTLRATIDWSYEMLSEAERILFRRLAVFTGGCTLEAVEGICAGAAGSPTTVLEVGDVFDLVSSLVDRSLLAVDQSAGGARYRLLETIREYAHQKLVQAQEEFELGARHWLWFTTLAEQANHKFWGHAHLEWVKRQEQEHDNVRAALAWCLIHDVERGGRLARALWQFWILRGYLSEADQTLASLSRQLPEATMLRADLLLAAFAVKIRSGWNPAAEKLVQESFQIYREQNDPAGSTHALQLLGAMGFVTGDYPRSELLFETSRALAKEFGNAATIACATLLLGETASYLYDYEQAHNLIEESLQRFEELGDQLNVSSFFVNLAPGLRHYGKQVRWWIVDEETIVLLRQLSAPAALGYAQANLGSLERGQGDAARARRWYEQARSQFDRIGDQAGTGQVLNQLGNLMSAEHEYRLAHELLEASLAIRRENHEPRGIGRTLCSMGNLAILEADFERARLLLNESWELFQEMGDKPGLAGTTNHLGNLALAEGDYARAEALHENCVERFQELGKRHAIALLNWAETAHLRGDLESARQRLESSLKLFQESGNRQGIMVATELLNELA